MQLTLADMVKPTGPPSDFGTAAASRAPATKTHTSSCWRTSISARTSNRSVYLCIQVEKRKKKTFLFDQKEREIAAKMKRRWPPHSCLLLQTLSILLRVACLCQVRDSDPVVCNPMADVTNWPCDMSTSIQCGRCAPGHDSNDVCALL